MVGVSGMAVSCVVLALDDGMGMPPMVGGASSTRPTKNLYLLLSIFSMTSAFLLIDFLLFPSADRCFPTGAKRVA
jgi:hypothetical protein